MKYLTKYVTVAEFEIDAEDTEAADKIAREWLKQMTSGTRLLGVVREDIGWPDTSATERPEPPRGTPPSGTPGTPTAPIEDQPDFTATAVAA